MIAPLAKTPRYVLLDDKRRLGPTLSALHCGPEYVTIYGFSDKQPYDLFCANCDIPLTPYPLVRDYLKTQLANSANAVHLVVVDAAGPQEAHLSAASMKSVLDALEQNANHVNILYQLILDRQALTYRVNKASADLDITSSVTENLAAPARSQRSTLETKSPIKHL